jgi:hypothetical protein
MCNFLARNEALRLLAAEDGFYSEAPQAYKTRPAEPCQRASFAEKPTAFHKRQGLHLGVVDSRNAFGVGSEPPLLGGLSCLAGQEKTKRLLFGMQRK